MDKEYRFCYNGTKEMFINHCRYGSPDKRISINPKGDFLIENYIISTIDNKIGFGIERAGHSGGYWFIPDIWEFDDRIELVGTIQYIGPEDTRDSKAKVRDKVIEVLFTIIFFPLFCLIKLFSFIEWIIGKIRKKPKPMTREGKLYKLMINHFGCSSVEITYVNVKK